jgi:hypothetical protein
MRALNPPAFSDLMSEMGKKCEEYQPAWNACFALGAGRLANIDRVPVGVGSRFCSEWWQNGAPFRITLRTLI